MSLNPRYLPSPEQIQAECEQIRQTWSLRVMHHRRGDQVLVAPHYRARLLDPVHGVGHYTEGVSRCNRIDVDS